MTETVEFRCWGCEANMTRDASSPGRPPRWCSNDCRNKARTINRRVQSVENAAARTAQREVYQAQRMAVLIRRYGPEGAAALMRVDPPDGYETR